MKKFLDYLKQIHLFEYSVYIILYTGFAYYFNVHKAVQIIGCCIIALAYMNTWEIEDKQKKKKNISTE